MIKNLAELNLNDIESILNKRLEGELVTTLKDLPGPDSFLGMKESVEIIKNSIEKDERITIVGDYDVDGVVASAILKEFFDIIGKSVDIVLPNRFKDGYGLSPKIVENLNTDLIITVDNGISAVEAAKVAKERGVKLVITDHHVCPPTLPGADAIIDPKQEECPFLESDIAGATVSWYLVAALKSAMAVDLDMKQFLDIMAFAILADAMPLKSINRSLVKQGIRYLNQSQRPAVKVLKKWLELNTFSTNDVVFSINPRLNSAGRMDDASIAYNFLTAKTEDEALKHLKELDGLNNLRKETEKEILELAKREHREEEKVIVVWGSGWHEGVIGIVAARLTEQFEKPSIVFSVNENKAKGSGRSNNDINLLELIRSSSEHLEGFGGHKQAAGMGCLANNLESFKRACLENYEQLNQEESQKGLDVMGKLNIGFANMQLVNLLGSYEPFGQAFPFPLFFAESVVPKKIIKMGNEKSHMLLIFEIAPYVTVSAVWFNYHTEVNEGESVSFIYTVNKNSFRGKDEAQIQVKKLL